MFFIKKNHRKPGRLVKATMLQPPTFGEAPATIDASQSVGAEKHPWGQGGFFEKRVHIAIGSMGRTVYLPTNLP